MKLAIPSVLLFFFLFTAPCAFAITCTTQEAPAIHLSTPPVAFCHLNNSNNTECFTVLSDPANASDSWGVMPDEKEVEGYGKAYAYLVINGAVNVEFSTSRLLQNRTVTAAVVCGSEEYVFNFTPVYVDFSEAPKPIIWVGANINALLLGFVIIIFAILLVAGAIKFIKDR